MTAHDLKPCPFCGGEARIETVNHDYGVTYSVGCFGSGRCGASFTLFDHRNDAIATWNRRTLSTITPAEVGGLWVPANPEHAKLGWTYDFDQVERIAMAAHKSTGYDATLEVVDFVMAEADRRHRAALTTERAAHAETKRELLEMEKSQMRQASACGMATSRAEAAEAQRDEALKALEQRDTDIAEFMGRLGSRWFLEQGWFPESVGAREDDARRAARRVREGGNADD